MTPNSAPKRRRVRPTASSRPLNNNASYDQFRKLCLKRDTLGKFCQLPFFAKLFRGFFVRVQTAEGRYRLCRIAGSAPDASDVYQVHCGNHFIQTRTKLTLVDLSAETPTKFQSRINVVSNQIPSSSEYGKAAKKLEDAFADRSDKLSIGTDNLESMYKQWFLPVTDEAVLLLNEAKDRIIRDYEAGHGACVEKDGCAKVWGTSPSHKVYLVFRTWVAPSTPKGQRPVSLEVSSTVRELSKTQGDQFAPGSNGEIQKYAGEYRFLLQHRCNVNRTYLHALCGHPDATYDESQPEITAWRIARRILSNKLLLPVFKSAILDRIEVPEVLVQDHVHSNHLQLNKAAQQTGCIVESVDSTESLAHIEHAASLQDSVVIGDKFLCVDNRLARKWNTGPRTNTLGATFRKLATAEQLFVIDLDFLLRQKAFTSNALGQFVPAHSGEDSASTYIWPNSLCWVPESTFSQGSSMTYENVAFAEALVRALSSPDTGIGNQVLMPRRRGNYARLYHGTSPTSVISIIANGFRRPQCKKQTDCMNGQCTCQMEGFGVYFAREDKAREFAERRGEPNSSDTITLLQEAAKTHEKRFGSQVRVVLPEQIGSKKLIGAVIEALVDVGHSKLALPTPDPAGIVRPRSKFPENFLDHRGTWYAWEGFDSLYLRDHSPPATHFAEWCIADPQRITVLAIHVVGLR